MNMNTTTDVRLLDIAVVGGSIAGCLAAALLARAGHRVHVYERSASDLVGRGGGIATSDSVIRGLKDSDLIDDDFPTIAHQHMRFAKRADGFEREGRAPWRPELDMQCVHWSGMFEALRQRIPDTNYHLNKQLVELIPVQGGNRLTFSDGTSREAELVVFCDGFRSAGRQMLFPEVELEYRNLVIWRGVLPESAVETGDALDDHPRISLSSMPGSFITYLMPHEQGSVVPGTRVINWAVYLPLTASELPQWMIDREGQPRTGTLPAGQFPLDRERELKSMMHEQLPTLYADIVEASVDTQFQPVRVCRAPAHVLGRACLVGDAAMPIQPLTGSGMFKAWQNARTLVEAIDSELSLDQSLQQWSDGQSALDERLLETGLGLEQAFIWEPIDLAVADEKSIERWWREKVRFPKDYSYLRTAAQ